MISVLDKLREITFWTVLLRLVLAMVCGGLIGLERTYKRRPVGFRTHTLICLGAALTMLTSEYLAVYMHYYNDITRLGAGVVAGVGFIGAGTIMITRRNKVRGLTTAAGFWVSAIVGLCLGAGYYEGGVITTLVVIAVELFFSKLEYWLTDYDPEITLYVEYRGREDLDNVLNLFQERDINIRNLEVNQISGSTSACAIISFRRRSREEQTQLLHALHHLDGIITVDEL